MTPPAPDRHLPGAEASAPLPLILIVDDMREIGFIIERLGRRFGYRSVQYFRAESAWEFLQHDLPDLVLVDIHLPGMSGLELCRRIRTRANLADMRLAILSSGMLATEIQEALRAGADDVLAKDLLAQPDAWGRKLGDLLRGKIPSPGSLPS